MKELFDDTDFADQLLKCPGCGWNGTGAETVIIDFYGVTADREVHCPSCDRIIGTLEAKGNSDRSTGDAGTADDQLSAQMG